MFLVQLFFFLLPGKQVKVLLYHLLFEHALLSPMVLDVLLNNPLFGLSFFLSFLHLNMGVWVIDNLLRSRRKDFFKHLIEKLNVFLSSCSAIWTMVEGLASKAYLQGLWHLWWVLMITFVILSCVFGYVLVI